MASPKEAFNLVAERKEQLRKVFTEFEAKKFSLGRIGATWKDIEEHFKEIETCLEKTHEAYTTKEKAFEARMKSVQSELDKRAAEVATKEQASVRRVQSEKDAAIAAIREQKRKLADDKRSWESEKQSFESGGVGKETKTKMNMDTAKASVGTGAQLKKNTDASKKSSKEQPAKRDAHPVSASMKKETQSKMASTLRDVSLAKKEGSAKQTSAQDEKASTPAKPGGSPASHIGKGNIKGNGIEDHTRGPKEPRPKLKTICQNMDYDGLRKLILENQKELKTLQDEVPSALKLCNDPADLVLKTLEAYLDIERKGKLELGKDDCYVCTMLVESLSEVQGDKRIISAKLRKSAKVLGDKWKALLKLEGQFGFNLVLVGRSFLQFTAAYGLASEYNQDDLCEIVAKVARPKHTAIVFRSLQLSEKAPDVIERLIKDGKAIAAISFASEFDLLMQFPPAPLLNAHVKEAKKAAKTILNNSGKTLAAQNEALQKELAALKAVIDVVKDNKLEDHYPLDNVEKQLATLEKTKADRKRMATASKTQQPPKKLRPDDGSPTRLRSGSRSPERPSHGIHDRDLYDGARMPPYGTVGVAEFNRRPPLGEYDRRASGEFDRRGREEYDRRSLGEFDQRRTGLYDAAYGASTNHPMLHGSYGRPSLDLTSLGYSSGSHGGHPNAANSYEYSSSLSSLGMGGLRPYL